MIFPTRSCTLLFIGRSPYYCSLSLHFRVSLSSCPCLSWHFSHEHLPHNDEQEYIVNAVDPALPDLVDHLSSTSNRHTLSILMWSRIDFVRYEGWHPYTSGPSAAVMAASSRISFKIGRTG